MASPSFTLKTRSMTIVTTNSEAEALLLEANLIKQLKPRFNVIMRDDKSFPYILIAKDHASPQILKHRGARARKGEYFGPFAGQHHPIPIIKIGDLAGKGSKRQRIRSQIHFAFAITDSERCALTCAASTAAT